MLKDDAASSGHSLAQAACLLLVAGGASVDVAVTHTLFAEGALPLVKVAGVGEVWRKDCIAPANKAVRVAQVLAEGLTRLSAAKVLRLL